MSAKSVKVVCRFRFEKPFDSDGKADPFDEWDLMPEEATIKIKDKTFCYDAVLPSDTTQEAAYEKIGRETINDFMNGFNATIFAYGQSGSGKTFSMVGPDEINDQLALDFSSIPPNIQGLFGTIPRATVQMFQMINNFVSEGYEYQVTCSYVEIYMEEITCLLNLKDKLKIKEYPDGNVEVEGKEKIVCKTPEDIFKVIATGTKNKTTGGTKQNARSSRSHTLLVVETESKSLEGQKKKSKLNLIDLAGSEKNRNTGATGDRAKEAIKINLSLTSLNMVFMALTTPGENKYIPFKDSKLTRLLKDSLGGNSLTTLLCTASKKVRYCEDTIGTLGFAQRAKKIKNDVKQNVEMGVKEYKYLTEALKEEILILRGDLHKSNIPIHIITDKKLLSFIPQDAIGGKTDGGEGDKPSDGMPEITSSKPSGMSPNKGNIKARKRMSILNLDEDEIILKYCELRAKYDNLLESASGKIYEMSQKQNQSEVTNNWSGQNIKTEEDNQILEKYKKMIAEKDKEIWELNDKVKEFNHENQGTQEMLKLNQEDIQYLSERVDKHKAKKKVLKEENAKLTEELARYSSKVEDLFKKVNLSEQANAVYNFKIEELQRKVDESLKVKEDSHADEKLLHIKIKSLEDEIKAMNEKEEGVAKEAVEQIKVDYENKIKEIKAENNVLKTNVSKLTDRINNIKSKVSINKNSNIFSGLLKKSSEGNHFLKLAQQESVKTESVLNEVWKDKIDELKKLRQNIIHLSPQTVSTRSIPDCDYQNIDFDDEDAFKKMQEKLNLREKKHNEEKEKQRKEKEEKEMKELKELKEKMEKEQKV